MIGKDSRYPPHIAFYIAHELGHIALGHLSQAPMVVDLERDELNHDDQEEIDADRFALELLTGLSRPTVLPQNRTYSARELARTALDAATDLRVEPGTLALCFGFSTNDWATANAAMPFIYQTAKPVWSEINKVALDQLHFGSIPEDARSYLKAVVGEPQSA